MPANPTTHPSTETLHALALGKLDDRAAEAVLSHLRTCLDCCRKAGSLPDDSFLGRLRDVHVHRETPSPDRTASPVTEDRQASRAPETKAPVARFPEEFPAPFGRYRILELLGKGGMGAVYLAHDTQLDRPVALKVPQFEAADEPQVLERFYREARAAATILHPNICPLHDVGEVAGTPYLTMAYIEGKPLSEFAAARPLTPRQSGLLVRKLALALQEAHKRGVIHRDLKPSNVMIDRRGEPIIMDFGLARRTRARDPRLTQRGSVLGTPAYMPPEQVSGDIEATGPASDVYSLGVILYELLTGRLPFIGDAMAMLSQVLMDEPPAPSELRPDLDPALEAICLKAMAKKIEDRYASMAELAAALTDTLRSSTPASGPAAAPPPKPAVVETKAEAEGFRTSQMGGLRSVANLHAQLRARKTGADRSRRRPKRAGGRKVPAWVWLTSAGLGVALLVGLVAAVVVRMKTRDGVLVVEVNEPNAEVYVDGNRVTVTWRDGGKKAEVRVKPGTHKVEVKKGGLTAYGEEVTLEAGGKKPIRARFERFDKLAPNTLTDKEKADGWKLLFDGTSTRGWHKYQGQAVGNRWKVADGALTLSHNNGRNGGDIVTDETFQDFEFSIQWKVTPGANSGILYRVSEVEDVSYGTGPEYQILDNARHPDGKQKETSAASCYALYAPSRDVTKPVGEWNQTLIVIKGNHVEHWLNGVKVVEYDFGSDDWGGRVAASKFKKWKRFGTIKKGGIVSRTAATTSHTAISRSAYWMTGSRSRRRVLCRCSTARI
jgi:hypothetical protein